MGIIFYPAQVLSWMYLPHRVDYQVCDLGCERSIRDRPVKNLHITHAYVYGRQAVLHARMADVKVCADSHLEQSTVQTFCTVVLGSSKRHMFNNSVE